MFVVHFRALFVENSRMVWYGMPRNFMVLHIQWRARDVLRVNKDICILGLHTYIHERTEGVGTACTEPGWLVHDVFLTERIYWRSYN